MLTRPGDPNRTPAGHPSVIGAPAAATRLPAAPAGDRTAVIPVLCVDDHSLLVTGLRAAFESHGGLLELVGSLPSAERLLEEVQRLRPKVVLMDIEMPGPDAFEMADRLHRLHPEVRIVILSAHVRDTYLAAAYRCGACGYFAKGDDLEAIVAGIVEVATSPRPSFALGPKVRERCLDLRPSQAGRSATTGEAMPPAPRLEQLTEREREILRLIGRGLSRTQIAEQLARSPKTVDGHQERLRRKLGLASRAELMRYAIREGLTEA